MNPLNIVLTLSLGFLISGCGNNSPLVMSGRQQLLTTTESFPGTETKINPRVDILFVIDNSHSMTSHQKELSANIPRFVESFAQQEFIDFHIGVTSVYDTRKFLTEDYKKRYPGKPQFGIGELRPLKGLNSTQRFVTKDTSDLMNVLEKTILIGTVAPNDGGPRWEESFSPVVAAFSDERSASTNVGFSRAGAHKAVVFVTDAEDQSQDLTVSQFNAFLQGLVSDDPQLKVATYGVISPTDDPKCNKDYDVTPDDAENPERIEELISISRGLPMSLCQGDFGSTLAQIGQDLWSKVTTRTLRLRQGRPDFNKPMLVMQGGVEIPQDSWSYDPHDVAVTIKMSAESKVDLESPIEIIYTRTELVNQQNGNTKVLGKSE